jgi:putative ABC transport system permease protein
MLKNYLLVALRRLVLERFYVLINVLSLALGIASFVIIALYLRSELTYDHHHVNHERIYRVTSHFQNAGSAPDEFAISPMGIGPLLTKDYPQLGTYVRLRPTPDFVLRHEGEQRRWDNVYLSDPTVFEVFTHKILYGNPQTALRTPSSIALSESVARYYFGEQSPIGQIMSANDMNYTVTLVYADLPENTHLRYDVLLPLSVLDIIAPGTTTSFVHSLWAVDLYTYLLVSPEFNRGDFDAIAAGFFKSYMAEQGAQANTTFRAGFQPLREIHFGAGLPGDLPTGNIFYVYGFAAVALFILLVACINYVNLATARATRRAKEVGMRTVLGASRAQLVGQFLGESLILAVIAAFVGLILVEIALGITPLGSLMAKEQLLAARSDPLVWLGILLLTLLVAVGAGLYPAFYLSAMSPLAALTHARRSWQTGFSMRQVLVFVQLCVTIGVIACTLLMTQQMRYLNAKPLGFDKEDRLLVKLRGYDTIKSLATIKSELRRQRGVRDVVTINIVPGMGNAVNLMPVENNAGTIEAMSLHRISVGMNFMEAMNVEVMAGRSFSESIASDAREAVIVNESFVKKAGWDEPLGKRVMLRPDGPSRVIGVVKDFHYSSLHNAIGPLLIHPANERVDKVPESQRALLTVSLIIVIGSDAIADTIGRVQSVIGRFQPDQDFEPVFLSDRLQQLYRSESDLMKLTGIFAAICIFIAVVGLFGLAVFTAEQRSKEIGIRQVLGASDGHIIALLSRHLLPLLVVAAIPASIASYYVMEIWLGRFAYRAGISWLTFLAATGLVAAVALATIALQAFKAAQSSGSEALRCD